MSHPSVYKSLTSPLVLGILLATLIIGMGNPGGAAPGGAQSEDRGTSAPRRRQILCSTFPMFIVTRELASGEARTDVALLLPANLGCPHDYSLTPQDMEKLEKADVFVINGLDMEEFLGAPVDRANPRLKIIDSSAGLSPLIEYSPEDEHGHDHDHDHDSAQPDASRYNPHLFTSPAMLVKIAQNIARELTRIYPESEPVFHRNMQRIQQRLNMLSDEVNRLGNALTNRNIVTQHGAFDYLARDMGINVIAVLHAHGGQEPSAADMLEIIQTMKDKGAGGIFTEPQYPPKVGQTLAQQAHVPVAVLDPVASGPDDADLDYFIRTMRQNLATLARVLGSR